jgi:protein-disulfide isomerase
MRFVWVAATVAVLGFAGPVAADDIPELSREQVEQIVHDYLLENPEIIIESLQTYQEEMEAAQADMADEAITDLSAELYDDADTPEAGNPDGDVVIVEFFDYRCGYCRHSAPDLFALLKDDPNVRVIFKEFPILGPGSELASRAALASREQGLYQPFHQALMSADIDFSEESIMSVASLVGLDTDKLKADMDSPEIDAHIAKNYELARALSIRGTPAFIVDGELIPGSLDRAEMDQLVKAARES